MSVIYFPGRNVPQESLPDHDQHLREIARSVIMLMQGHDNSSMSITLDAGVTTTLITDPRISLQTCVSLMAATSNAAAALPTTFVVCERGLATIHHANNAQTDRTFTVSISG